MRLQNAVVMGLICFLTANAASLDAQETKDLAEKPIVIADEPKGVDPATLLPEFLTTRATVNFDGAPLKTVFTWLQNEARLNLLVDYKSLAAVQIFDTEPVHDRLQDAPVYLLLNRLEALGVAWYLNDRTVAITSRSEAYRVQRMVAYSLGDLFDAGYTPDDAITTIKRCSGGTWGSESGNLLLIGDIAFVQQTEAVHLEIAGLLSALRKHGHRTLTLDSPGNADIRAKLERRISVDFEETPMIAALKRLSNETGVEFRSLKNSARERVPVTLKLTDQTVRAVLQAMTVNWYVRDEVIWIAESGSPFRKTAVYDVRDLCRDASEASALESALRSQSRAAWQPSLELGGVLASPQPGVLVVRHAETVLDEIDVLLDSYRMALRASKVRNLPDRYADEVVTGYYRLPTPMARDVMVRLPRMIAPESWRSQERPDAVGTIDSIEVDADVTSADETRIGVRSKNKVLVVRQTRRTHRLLADLIRELQNSQSIDPRVSPAATMPQTPSILFGSRLIPSPAP